MVIHDHVTGGYLCKALKGYNQVYKAYVTPDYL